MDRADDFAKPGLIDMRYRSRSAGAKGNLAGIDAREYQPRYLLCSQFGILTGVSVGQFTYRMPATAQLLRDLSGKPRRKKTAS